MNAPRRRHPVVRGALTAVLVAVVAGSFFALKHAVYEPMFGRGPVTDLLSPLFPMVALGLLAPFASYRWRDGLWWLFPLAGLYLTAKVAWRVSGLPHRDWPPRPDEIARGVQAVPGVA
ncbi:hypothetical protein [Catellatospora vulcania]|uniref:hypothetical protein n=1 Tax=Catellatospora vulcania TaxID=1460450 RepID=UPI0012D43741|nr:hypothetical protein [Catellatospora vulcania]